MEKIIGCGGCCDKCKINNDKQKEKLIRLFSTALRERVGDAYAYQLKKEEFIEELNKLFKS